MINTTAAFEEYIRNLQFSCVYVEKSFPLKVQSSILCTNSEALDYLIGSAAVGNKSAGFFRFLPTVDNIRPIRGICVFITLELPAAFSIPVFFCRDADALLELFPLALKISQDINMPVQIVLAANALHNYSDKNFKLPDLDRLTPYIQNDTFLSGWDAASKNKKLAAGYKTVASLVAPEPFSETMVFEEPFLPFPRYLFPINIKEQRELFKDLRVINTTKSNAPFFHYLLNDLLNMNIHLETDMEDKVNETATLLCPGCPFTVFASALSFADYIVFTSITCTAIEKKFGFPILSLQEFLGINAKKLNRQTLYIGNLSELPSAGCAHSDNFHFIFLKDGDIKTLFPIAPSAYKLKYKHDFIFPYSCGNIKRYNALKVNKKKCKCTEDPVCAIKTACPSLAAGENHIWIDEAQCTGCRACVQACKYKALS
jgi:NAD-dependent dihydropyrimidine dehydrogenase PreA subunit